MDAIPARRVSDDDGATWHPATGREQWRYRWTPRLEGPATIRGRAVDDSGNLGPPSDGVSVVVGPAAPAACPCSIFEHETPGQASVDNGSQAVELGVRFRSDDDGFITGLRFYKGEANTGTHVGHLWTAGGQELAEATFTCEVAPDTRRPQVMTVSPAPGASDIDPGTRITARFDEPMDPATINDTTFELRPPGGNPAAAAVSYDAGTRTARLTPGAAPGLSGRPSAWAGRSRAQAPATSSTERRCRRATTPRRPRSSGY